MSSIKKAYMLSNGGHTGLLGTLTISTRLNKILGLNVTMKNDKSNFLPIMTVKLEENVVKCDKGGVRSSR